MINTYKEISTISIFLSLKSEFCFFNNDSNNELI